jgi:hypothetical protein
MANLDNVLQQLREEHKQAQGAIEKLRQAISTIESLNGNSGGMSVNGARPKKTMSAAARRKIAQAQRARWAKIRKQSLEPSAKHSKSGPRRISAEGRKRIAAAARARRARVRALQSKKAA